MVCLHETVSKIDLRRFNAACRAARRAGRCPFWPGLPRAIHPPVSVKELRDVAKRLPACPHDCLVVSLPSARMAAATHKQLSSIGWLLAKWRTTRGRVVLVLDEGQHIVKSALSMVKDSISLRTVERAAKEAGKYGFKDLGEELEDAVREYGSMLSEDGEIEADDLLPDASELALAGDEVQEAKLRENYVPASYLLSVADFKQALRGSKPILVREGRSMRLEASADPVDVLRSIYDGWHAAITMSATISGELLESLLGKEVTLLRAGWPFEEENLTAHILKRITTKYPARTDDLISDMAWAVRVVAKTGRRALVFFPSYDLLRRSLERVEDSSSIIAEEPGMTQEEVEAIVKQYEEGTKKIVLSVFNGRLAEGVDLSADLVVCLGVPFSPPSIKTEALLKRLTEIIKDEKRARIYGYILPALWSAIQAAGRAIRGPGDWALVLLADDRYKPLLRLFPKWFSERVVDFRELEDLPIILREAM